LAIHLLSSSGLVAPRPGQIQVDPGVIIMGYPGDPVLDDPNKVKRPSWTKDGSMLVFRKLEQSVMPFEDYLKKNGPRWREFIPGGDISPPLTDQQGSDLFGARLIGRWKSVCIHVLLLFVNFLHGLS
jgi:hypothetical protein